MKDYSLNQSERNDFILNYEKKEDIIVVNFASSGRYVIPNTDENEKKLLDKMQRQVSEVGLFKQKVTKWKNDAVLTFYITLIIGAIIAIYAGTGEISFFSNLSLYSKVLPVIALTTSASTPSLIRIVKGNKLLKDIKKNEYYVTHEEKIVRGLENNNVLANSKNLPKDLSVNGITINDVDNLSLSDLNTVVNNTTHEEVFSFDTLEDEKREKVRSRKR